MRTGLLLSCTLAGMLAFSGVALAKRGSVEYTSGTSLTYKGTRYDIATDDKIPGGYIKISKKRQKKPTLLQIYKVKIIPNLEEDAQWVFIRSIKLENGMIVLENERGEQYELNPKTRRVIHIVSPPQELAPTAAQAVIPSTPPTSVPPPPPQVP